MNSRTEVKCHVCRERILKAEATMKRIRFHGMTLKRFFCRECQGGKGV